METLEGAEGSGDSQPATVLSNRRGGEPDPTQRAKVTGLHPLLQGGGSERSDGHGAQLENTNCDNLEPQTVEGSLKTCGLLGRRLGFCFVLICLLFLSSWIRLISSNCRPKWKRSI